MARHKEFDQEAALRGAITAFGRKGFTATSTEDLMTSMNVGRQSMYDTFGDKRELFLKALALYSQENMGAIAKELRKPGSGLTNIRDALLLFTERSDIDPTDGCMGINALCEFGLQDHEVLQAADGGGNTKATRQLLLKNLRRARAAGELRDDADITALADFFDNTLAGLRISARAGKTRAALRRIVQVAFTAFQ
ncbi:TetR/AcrR family transcriptional regulator [Granulicella paludicola]|uniref:TetR/AcrR family transcriptional regulator n=1 Tax=Granulicella paludicola TaxID=474951 RepID=UPI0021DF4F06|nr:TetR/AcrR family transcriptional regulator [Granulicella paludicola]